MTQKLCKSFYLGLLAPLSSMLALSPHALRAQARAPVNYDCYPRLDRAKPVSPGKGWAVIDRPVEHSANGAECVDERLYWTDNDGQIWREITPPKIPSWKVGSVFFLNSSHGWMISTNRYSDDSDEPFYVFSTEDGGKNWRSVTIQQATYKLTPDYWPTQVYFADRKHGWILWHYAVMNTRANALLATSDGGRTWKRLPDPPGPGPLDFSSAHLGWMIGGHDGGAGIFVVERDQLWTTRDGGGHWAALPVQMPPSSTSPDSTGYIDFTDLKFRDSDCPGLGVRLCGNILHMCNKKQAQNMAGFSV